MGLFSTAREHHGADLPSVYSDMVFIMFCVCLLYTSSLFGKIYIKELVYHGKNLLDTYYFDIRISEHKFCESCGVIRLHMLNYYEIKLFSVKSVILIFYIHKMQSAESS